MTIMIRVIAMNRLNIKQVLLALAIIACRPTYAMDALKEVYQDPYKLYENPTVYSTGVAAIDTGAGILSNSTVRLGSLMRRRQETPTQKKIRLQYHNKAIDWRLQDIEKNLIQDEKNAIADLYKDFNLTKDEQQAINTGIDQLKQFEKEYMSRPHKKAASGNLIFGPEFSPVFEKAGIHPESIKKQLTSDTLTTDIAEASSMLAKVTLENPLKINKVINPPTITINPIFYKRSQTSQDASIMHEIGHLGSQHTLTTAGLTIGISAFTGATREQIENNKNYKKLATIHERQAEILHKAPEWTPLMRASRGEGYYPVHLFLGHYAQLAEIDELHKLKEKFKNYQPTPVQKIPTPKLPSRLQQRQYPQTPTNRQVYPNMLIE